MNLFTVFPKYTYNKNLLFGIILIKLKNRSLIVGDGSADRRFSNNVNTHFGELGFIWDEVQFLD